MLLGKEVKQQNLHKFFCSKKETEYENYQKIKALFFKDDHPVSLDLSAAEIKEGKAFLHPKEDRDITYLVKSDDIEIRLSKGKNLTDKDILVMGKRKRTDRVPANPKEKQSVQPPEKKIVPPTGDPGNIVYDLSRFKKKTFSVSLYPEEYDRLMDTIQKYGYKRSEFILASAQTATQGTMARAQKKVVMVRKELRKEEKELRANQHKHN